MSDLLIGALSALLATNQPVALSNLVHAKTGIAVPVTNPDDPVEKEYRRVLELEEAATDEVDQWIKANQETVEKSAGLPAFNLRGRIEVRFEPVKKAYEAFVAAHPRHARGRLAFGGFLSDIGDEIGAHAQWDKARELVPDDPAAWNNLANYYGHNGPITNAFVCYDKAIDLKPSEALYYQNFATTVFLFRPDAMEYFKLTEAQVFDKAMGLYRKARELDPGSFLLATDLAQSYYTMKATVARDAAAAEKLANTALAAWNDALKIAPDENARQGVHVHLARWQIEQGRFDAARANLNLLTNAAFASTKRALEKKITKLEPTNTPPATAPVPPKP